MTAKTITSSRRSPLPLWTFVVLFAGLGTRTAAMLLLPSVLERDIDGYRVLARNLVEHGVYGVEDSPRAHRPPLYPLVLAPLTMLPRDLERLATALLHMVLGMATVALTLRMGHRLGLGAGAYVAGALVAVDPLLVFWGTQLMTETLYALLLALLLTLVIEGWQYDSAASGLRNDWAGVFGAAVLYFAAAGFCAGLTALCRPEAWVFTGLVLAALAFTAVRRHGGRAEPNPWRGPGADRSPGWPAFLAMSLTSLAVCLPWVLRNQWSLGKPILTTTHGGYTLLLANNPVFYREVVQGPWGVIWEKESNERWHAEVERRFAGLSETARDRACYRAAWANIRNQPAVFLRSVIFRIARLWRFAPHETGLSDLILPWVRYGVGAFYGLQLALLLTALARGITWRLPWLVFPLLLGATTLVHAFYWSNMRMRAGVIPAVALLVASRFSKQGKAAQVDQ